MMILERIFDKVLVRESPEQADSRSTMRGFFRADEAGLLEFCKKWELPAVFYSAGELQAVPGEFTASERVLRVTGVDNVCERAAMVGAETLLVRKTAMDGVTVAIAQEHWEVCFA